MRKSVGLIGVGYVLAMVCFLGLFSTGYAANLDELRARPLGDVVTKSARSIKSGPLQVPLITWGGDVATVYTADAGLFRAEGLDVSLFVENNFPRQVERCLDGETPFIRGTMGMINTASEVFKRNGIELVVIYQLTWSTGGDALVTRSGVNRPQNLSGKTVALQLYGPHMDYLANILDNSGVAANGVTFKWFKELTYPSYDTRGKIVDPVSAFSEDSSIDGVMCIIPDALSLTSGGKIGTGAAGSVKGAKILLSTKTASRIIADVYAVRGDYFAANKEKVESFVKALLKGEEALDRLKTQKKENAQDYKKLMGHAAGLLFDSVQAIPEVEALLGDCDFVGYDGNVRFFTGVGTTRTMEQLTREIQSNFLKMNLMSSKVTLRSAQWDYTGMTGGLSQTSVKPKPMVQKFDTRKVQERISVESTSWAEEGTLFQVEINFGPNQSDFSDTQYAGDFKRAVGIAQTYGGALIIIEGHSDPLGILQARQKGLASVEISQMEQQAKNLSLERAREVRKSFLEYCKKQGLALDESQFVAVGMGISNPKYNPPKTKEEWNANRRVVFRIKQIEAELSDFTPLK